MTSATNSGTPSGAPYLLALDQGTSSSRSIVFDREGHIVALAQQELTQIYPRPGWVEHDPREIWRSQLATARDVLKKAKLDAKDIHAIGITNQRETTVLWNRKTGEPVHNAIVWQDRRAEPMCAQLRNEGMADTIRDKTGLVIDAYFSGTKLRWLLDNVPGARAAADRGELAFGTVDSWLMWQLTGGKAHVTDVSNASRTMLFNVHQNRWDVDLLRVLDIPASLMPTVQPSSSHFADIDAGLLGRSLPIGGVAGDQQSALFGQACFDAGMAKNTYGTGCFLLMHTGEAFRPSQNGLLVTSAAQIDATPRYAMEGSVFVGGAVVQWLRDGLKAIKGSAEVQSLAESVPDAGGVMMVPAFTGLGAPYWNADARGTITGLTRGTTVAHIARAALESIAYQSAALLQAMSRDAVAAGGQPVAELRVDGGASVNDLLMQFQADLLGIPVVRPEVTETTALGAAYLAGLSTGVYSDVAQLTKLWKVERRFLPTMERPQAEEAMARWAQAVRRATLA
ncbi:glycerol kinase GlpK [Variovorax sp. PAMC28562]|uniref:glycerol kinase GlpK n=1 Tax=Variovorax sp. PAMC28562 TaxID=2762323 RepID=UPI00164DA099|nr:glycerol kinase GlpK [Variovorax sp. PAMC28562]QNK72411.1 glycerol kinase GlpK [Variovorax sp. PAMC28562]